jgi:hypothetical protein
MDMAAVDTTSAHEVGDTALRVRRTNGIDAPKPRRKQLIVFSVAH